MNIPDWVIQKAQHAKVEQMYRNFNDPNDGTTRSQRAEVAGFVVIAEWMREKAAQIHENINVACSHEEATHAPGAGAMGAVIKYRDEIRKIGEDGTCNCGIVKNPHEHSTPI